MPHSKEDLLKAIDHTNLNPNATAKQIHQLCEEAIRYGFGAVCVAPSRVGDAIDKLASAGGSVITVASVVGFPHGNTLMEVKEFETMRGVALPVIAAQLGHADSQMVERHYGHLAPSYVADTIRAAFGTMGLVEPDNVTTIASRT